MGEDKPGGRIDRQPLEHRGADKPRPTAVSNATQTELDRSFAGIFNPLELTPYEGPLQKEGNKPAEYIYIPIGALIYSAPSSDPNRVLLGKTDSRSINGMVVDEKIVDPDTNTLTQRIVSTAYGKDRQSKKVSYWIDRNPDGTIYGVPKNRN